MKKEDEKINQRIKEIMNGMKKDNLVKKAKEGVYLKNVKNNVSKELSKNYSA